MHITNNGGQTAEFVFMKKVFLFLFSLVLSVDIFPQNYPIANIQGEECYVYTVEKGDGLYRISKKFGVLQSDIYRLNDNIEME